MKPSSRTPEGAPNLCPICGKMLCIEPSSFPLSDAPCPHCGHLLWFADDDFSLCESEFDFVGLPKHEAEEVGFTARDRRDWKWIAAISTLLVGLIDQSIVAAIAWLLVAVVFGQRILPKLFQLSYRWAGHAPNLYIGVMFGWALVPGPVVGVIVGPLVGVAFDLKLSAFSGALLGLIVSPCFAVVQGVVTAAALDLFVWMYSGKRLSSRCP